MSLKAQFLLVSEDGGQATRDALKRLLERMCELVVPHSHSRRAWSDLKPSEQGAVSGFGWRDRTVRNARTDLLRRLVRHLARPDGFVFFHFDADSAWPRDGEPPEPGAQRAFGLLREDLRHQLDWLAKREGAHVDHAWLEKVIPVVPYFEIESWLLQNTQVARAQAQFCAREKQAATLSLVSEWEADRRALDEVAHPKDAVCFGDSANFTLAVDGYPTEAVFEVGASFARTVNTLVELPELIASLRPSESK